MVSRNWSIDNIGYKRYSWLAPYFKEILLPLIATFYYNLLLNGMYYRVSIKSLPDYKHLLQENYVEYKIIFFTIT